MGERDATRRRVLRTAGGLGTASIAAGGVPAVGAQEGEDESSGTDTQTTPEEETEDAAPDVFIACRLDNSVAVMEPESKEITDEIPVGKQPLYVSVAPDGQYAYAPNTKSNDVTVIDAREKEAIKTIPLEGSPNGVNVSPATGNAWVEIGSGVNQIAVIDNESLEVTATIDTGKGAHNVVFDTQGGYAWVTYQLDNAVGVIDLDCLEEVERVEVHEQPHNIHIDVEHDRVYTANALSNDMGIIDTEERTLLNKRPLTDGNADIHATLDGEYIWVSGIQSDAVTVHSPNEDYTDYRIEDIITVENQSKLDPPLPQQEYVPPGLGPHGCFVSPYREEAYITLTGRDQLVVIDTETYEEKTRVDTPKYPFFSDQQYEYGN